MKILDYIIQNAFGQGSKTVKFAADNDKSRPIHHAQKESGLGLTILGPFGIKVYRYVCCYVIVTVALARVTSSVPVRVPLPSFLEITDV